MAPEQIISIVSAVTSVAAIIIALTTAMIQKRQSDLTMQVTVLRDFVREFFHDTHIRRIRYVSSQYGLNKTEISEPPVEVFDLLDFFDTLAIYHNKKAIDSEMAWTTFYYWASHYYDAFEEDVVNYHKVTGLDMYRNLHNMIPTWRNMGVRLNRVPKNHITSTHLKEFFEDEIATCKDQAP